MQVHGDGINYRVKLRWSIAERVQLTLTSLRTRSWKGSAGDVVAMENERLVWNPNNPVPATGVSKRLGECDFRPFGEQKSKSCCKGDVDSIDNLMDWTYQRQ
jgi:hypothetical protein